MTICYFGIYDNQYPRNRNIIKGLKDNNVEIIEIIDKTPGIKKFWKLFKKHWQIRKKYDLMIVGFPGQIIVPFAKLISRKMVIFDLHVSYYDSIIIERKNYKPGTFKAYYFYFLDWLSCRIADKILLDTKEHIEYVSRLLRIKKDKFITVYHGIDDSVFKPVEKDQKNHNKFIISFHGYIQLLNGMDLVIRAMKILEQEKIELWIIGGGSEYKKIKKLAEKELKLKNIKFYPPMPPNELIKKISQADLGLGFFSKSMKIDRVIANKIYELIALKVPVLTGDSTATREHYEHKKHIYYCERNSVEAIALAIIELKNNKELRKYISEEAYYYTKKNISTAVLGEKLLSELKLFIK